MEVLIDFREISSTDELMTLKEFAEHKEHELCSIARSLDKDSYYLVTSLNHYIIGKFEYRVEDNEIYYKGYRISNDFFIKEYYALCSYPISLKFIKMDNSFVDELSELSNDIKSFYLKLREINENEGIAFEYIEKDKANRSIKTNENQIFVTTSYDLKSEYSHEDIKVGQHVDDLKEYYQECLPYFSKSSSNLSAVKNDNPLTELNYNKCFVDILINESFKRYEIFISDGFFIEGECYGYNVAFEENGGFLYAHHTKFKDSFTHNQRIKRVSEVKIVQEMLKNLKTLLGRLYYLSGKLSLYANPK